MIIEKTKPKINGQFCDYRSNGNMWLQSDKEIKFQENFPSDSFTVLNGFSSEKSFFDNTDFTEFMVSFIHSFVTLISPSFGVS